MKVEIDKRRFYLVVVALLVGLGSLTACSSAGGAEPAVDQDTMESMDEMGHGDDDMAEMDHDEDMSHDDEHEHDDSEVKRVPNEGGAAMTIISPNDGDTFSTLDQIIVEVEVENFELGADGNHWHVYVDGTSFGMVMGGNTDQPLSGLGPGEHEISVYMSIDTHEEYEDGDSVTVTVAEE